MCLNYGGLNKIVTLRFRAILGAIYILVVFLAVLAAQWQMQGGREGDAENRIKQLMRQAFSSIFIAAERDSYNAVKSVSTLYMDRGLSKTDLLVKDAMLADLGAKHDLDFFYVLSSGGHVIDSFHPQDAFLPQFTKPLRTLDSALFNQVVGLRWQTTGVGYWQQEPLYLSVEKVEGDDQGVRYIVAGYYLSSLFGELNAIYEFEAGLRPLADPLEQEGVIRTKSQLQGLVTAPIDVWIMDKNSLKGGAISWALTGVICASLVGALLIWFVFRQLMVNRLRDFIRQAHVIGGSQDYGKRVKLRGNDELNDLVSHYNSVVSALEYSYNLMAKANLITTELLGRVDQKADSALDFNAAQFTPAGAVQNDKDDLRQSLDVVAKLSDVVERQTLDIYYQPVADVATGKIVSYEALCRWLDPDLGVVEPADFMALAEKSGQMAIIGQQMVTRACNDIKKAHGKGPGHTTVSINLSLSQFNDPDLIGWLSDALKNAKLKPEFVELEVKEYALARDIDQAIIIIDKLISLGVTVCIDDYGLSRLSLMYLQRLPVKKIKLAKSFADRIVSEPKEVAFIKGVALFAAGLGVKVVVKGVETEEQLYTLKRVPDILCQGYAICQPMPADELAEKLGRDAKI